MEGLIEKAREIALQALNDVTRSNGTPFIGHPDAVAAIVRDEIGLGEESVAAVYLHEATREHHDIDISAFPPQVRTIVEGLNKISTIKPKDTRLEAENYKKLIVQYSKDPRVTVIKIADRLEIMRSLNLFPRNTREQKQLETLMLYIPLAHQLGLYNIKSELEDIYFKFASPEQYRQINQKLKATEKDRRKLTEEFIEPLKKKLTAEGINYKLKIRTKTAYSIQRKMTVQNVPFEGVYDVFAIRFILDCDADRKTELDQCWKVYSFVTEEYEPDLNRLRDWLTNPKPNGYESLHITVKNKQGASLEVQIRTKRMDDIAENGLASHWSYKGIKHEQTLDNWLSTVRYNIEHPSQVKPEDIPLPPSNEIFVFSPTGELIILPAGASVLDFAFRIHTGLGCHCTGGRINGKAVSIKEKLSTGDVVEILSNKNQRPSYSWLGYVVSSKARSKIKVELDADLRRQAAAGRELLERRLRNWKLELKDDLVAEMMHYLKYTSVITFMADIGNGEIDINDIKNYIQNPELLVTRNEGEEEKKKALRKWKSSDDILVINARGVKGLEYNMASCCNPKHGDEVFGFVTRSAGIKIHREDCPNAKRMKEMYPYRVQKVVWQEKEA
ncbi:MAG: HD domain-containing protein [Bacteroidales bacterium]|nr:HD domain-containing protein [Bacteroidales bacterium]